MSNITCIQNTGEIENKSLSVISFEWKIPNFSSLPLEEDYCVQSPFFVFLGTTWYLRLYPNKEIREVTDSSEKWYKCIVICVELEHPTNSINCIEYTIGTKKYDGSLNKFFSGQKDVGVGSEKTIECYTRFLTRQTIPTFPYKFEPQDPLIISCLFYTKQVENIDRTIQETLHNGKDECTQTDDGILKDTEDETINRKTNTVGIENLANQFKDLLLSEKDFDTTIKVDDREFHAHKLILGVRSSVFESMFRHDTTERSSGIVTILDCDPLIFQDFLLYLYSGKIENLSTENVFGLYALADKYDTKEVKSECVTFLLNNISVVSFCDIIILALIHEEQELFQAATDFFVRNSIIIGMSVTWQRFLKDYPVEANELYLKALEFLCPE